MWLSIGNFLFGWIIKFWQNRGPSRLETVNEELGEKTAALDIQQAQQKASDDEEAGIDKAQSAIKPVTADSLPNHTPSNDPDFRD